MDTTTLIEFLRSSRGRLPKDPALVLRREDGRALTVTVDSAGSVLIRSHHSDGSSNLVAIMPDELQPFTEAILRAQGIPTDLRVEKTTA